MSNTDPFAYEEDVDLHYPDVSDEADDDSEVTDEEAASVHFVQGLYDLDAKLGRPLTSREVEAIEDRVEADHNGMPDVKRAYDSYYSEADHSEPDLTDSLSRTEFMNERLRDLQNDE